MNEEYLNEKTSTEKFIDFFKKNALNLVLILISVIFLVKDLVQIKESGKTILEIVASSITAFVVGIAFNIILGKKGIIAGKESPVYKSTQSRYITEIEKTDENIEKLDEFCDMKNEIRIKKAQIAILRHELIKYDDFINKTIDEVCKTEQQKKCWLRAQKVKIQMITPENLLSETDERYEKGKKELTISEYERNQITTDVFTKILIAFIFGYFSVEFIGGYENLIWGAVKIGIWLLLGIIKYIQNYSYITDVHRAKIHRKINYLVEFNTLMKKGGSTNE